MGQETRKIFTPHLSFRQFLAALAFGTLAALTLFSGLAIPLGHGILAEPSEVFVTLGAAFSGPFGGIIVGLLQGVVYAPERNIPAHMLAGFLWGAWYVVLYRWSLGKGRWTRAALWAASIPVYYYVLLLPLHIAIASFTLGIPLLPLYAEAAGGVLPEMAFTLLVTSAVMAALPERWAAPLD